jgi:hypothetical protein
MKIKQPVASGRQQPHPQVRPEADTPIKASVQSDLLDGELKYKQPTMAERRQTYEDAHLLSQEEVDLAFERDEILEPPHLGQVTSGPKVWTVKGMDLKLSALEATVTIKSGVFTYDDLEL